jgi:hypothetical protein
MAIAVPRIIARDITFKIGSTSYSPEVNAVELTLGDTPGGVMTFGSVRPDGEWSLKLDGYTAQASASLYQYLWANFSSEVAFEINPGGGTAGAQNPKYSGTIIINELPPLSLMANEESAFSITLRVKNTGLDIGAKLYYGITIAVA